MISRINKLAALLLCAATALLLLAGIATGSEKVLIWKAVDDALLRVDDRPVTEWNVYEAAKKNDPVLLQMGKRFLFIQVKEHRVFEIPADKIGHKGADLMFDPADHSDKPLDTSDWLIRDVGLAYRCRITLVGENRVIDLQIPHPLDLRRGIY